MRKISLVLLAVITVAAWSWYTPRQAEGVGQTVVFPLSVSGKVTQTDIETVNGVIHVIDKVMLPK